MTCLFYHPWTHLKNSHANHSLKGKRQECYSITQCTVDMSYYLFNIIMILIIHDHRKFFGTTKGVVHAQRT